MKKLLKLVAASMMLVGLAACENGPTPTPGPTPEEQEEALAEAKEAAIGALEAYAAGKDAESYTSDALEAILLEVNAGKAAINAAADVFSVNTALNAAKAAIDTVAPSQWKIGLHAFLDSTSLDCSDIDFDSFEIFEKVEFSVEEDEDGEYGFLYVGGENSEYAGIGVLYDCLLSGWSLVDADEEDADWGYTFYEFRTGFNAEGDYLDVQIAIIESGSLYELFADAGSYIYISQYTAYSAADTAEMVNTLLGDGIIVEAEEEGESDWILLQGLGLPEEALIDEEYFAALGDFFLLDYETGNTGEDLLKKIAENPVFEMDMGYVAGELEFDDVYTSMYNFYWYDENVEEEIEDEDMLVYVLEGTIESLKLSGLLPDDLALYDDEDPVDYDEDEEWAYGYFYSESEQLNFNLFTYYTVYGDIVYDAYAYGIDYVTGINVTGDPSALGEGLLAIGLEADGWTIEDAYATSLGNLAIFDGEAVATLEKIPYIVFFNEETYMNLFSMSIMLEERMNSFNTIAAATGIATAFGVALPNLPEWGVWADSETLPNGLDMFYLFGFDAPAIVGEGDAEEELDVGENYLAIYNTVTAEDSGWTLIKDEAEDDDDNTGPLVLATDDETGPLDDEEEEEIPAEFMAYSEAAYGLRIYLYVISGSYYTEVYVIQDYDVNSMLASFCLANNIDDAVVDTIPDFLDGTKHSSISFVMDYATHDYYLVAEPADDAVKLGLVEKEIIELFDEENWKVDYGSTYGEWTITSKNTTGDKLVFELSYDRENHVVIIHFSTIPENNA